MKKLVPILCAGALVASLSFPQDPVTEEAGGPDLEKRVAALEAQLASARQELGETRALLDETVAWVQARGEGSTALLTALDASEEAGFTAGINYQSRVVLLDGLRAWWAPQSKGLPGKPKPKPARGKPKVVEDR